MGTVPGPGVDTGPAPARLPRGDGVLPLGAQGGVLACVAAAGRLEGLECLLVGEGPSPPAATGLTEHAPVSREGAGPGNTGGHGVLPGGRGGSRVEPDRRKNGSSCGAGSGSKGGAVGSGNPPLASLQGLPVARVGPQAPPDCSPSPTVSTMTSLRYLLAPVRPPNTIMPRGVGVAAARRRGHGLPYPMFFSRDQWATKPSSASNVSTATSL